MQARCAENKCIRICTIFKIGSYCRSLKVKKKENKQKLKNKFYLKSVGILHYFIVDSSSLNEWHDLCTIVHAYVCFWPLAVALQIHSFL